MPISVAATSKASVIAGLNSTRGMGVPSLVFVVCCVRNGLCEELITRSASSTNCVCARAPNCVWSINLNSETAYATLGLVRQGIKIVSFITGTDNEFE